MNGTSAASTVAGRPDAPPPALVAALGGGARFTHRAGLGAGSWTVEVDGEPTVVGSLASPHASAAARAAGRRGVGPQVVRWGEGWLATELLQATHLTPLELRRPLVCREVAELLAVWHATPLSALQVRLPVADLAASLRAYRGDEIRGAGIEPGGLLGDAVARALRALAGLPAGEDLVPCHLDVMANLLRTPEGLRLVDFDFAALASPTQELGQLIWEGELDRGAATELVAAYRSLSADETDVAGPPTLSDHVAEAATWCVAAGVTWTVWAAGRPEPVMHRYARRCWERVQSHWAWPDAVACG